MDHLARNVLDVPPEALSHISAEKLADGDPSVFNSIYLIAICSDTLSLDCALCIVTQSNGYITLMDGAGMQQHV